MPATALEEPAPVRCRDQMLGRVKRHWGGTRDLWVFGYASLIWRPEFEAAERRPAVVHGWHRALRMCSTVNRGTPECPGLVFALVKGGSCRGMAYRLDPQRAEQELERLWEREMPRPVYDPRWVPCRTPCGSVEALAFTLSSTSESHVGPMDDIEVVDIFRKAQGRYGTTLHYVTETAASLRQCGIHDREIERLVALARQHALLP